MRDGKYFACLLAANCWAGLEPGLNSSIIPALNIRIILSWRYLACQASYLQSTIYSLELLICDLIELLPVETKNSDIPMISIYHNTRISLAWGNKEKWPNDGLLCYEAAAKDEIHISRRLSVTVQVSGVWHVAGEENGAAYS